MQQSRLICRKAALMEAELGDELVALDVNQGLCFGLNAPAAAVWRLLEQPRTFDDLKLAIVAEFDVSEQECSGDLAELLDDMRAKDLVTFQ